MEVVVAFCLGVSWTSDHLGISIELGAFLAGVMVSMTPVAVETQNHIEPVRNIFGALFLASVGMIINPCFLWVHSDVLLCTLFAFIIFKCFYNFKQKNIKKSIYIFFIKVREIFCDFFDYFRSRYSQFCNYIILSFSCLIFPKVKKMVKTFHLTDLNT